MARRNRSDLISPNESCIVHVFSRVVRRCFLLGGDPLTGKNYDHHKVWIEDMLKHHANYFAIDQARTLGRQARFHTQPRTRELMSV